MDAEKQRIAIAEACGWRWQATSAQPTMGYWDFGIVGRKGYERTPWVRNEERSSVLPDYLNDLNAMQTALETLNSTMNWINFVTNLSSILSRDCNALQMSAAYNSGQVDYWAAGLLRATASQCAEAFLRTIGKWEE